MSGSLSLGKASWAGAPARMENLLLLLLGKNPQQQSALLPTTETEEAPGKQISLPKLPSSHGKMMQERMGDCGYCHCCASASDAQNWGESSQLSPDVGRLKLLNISGKYQLSFGLIHSHTVFFLAPIYVPQTEGIWSEGPFTLLRWHLGQV